jgi:NitT/TauT family transport system substrate-binding protein
VTPQAMDQEFALRPTFGLDEQLKLMSRSAGGSTVDGWFSEIGKFLTEVGTVPANPETKSYVTDDFLKRVAADAKLKDFATEFDKK